MLLHVRNINDHYPNGGKRTQILRILGEDSEVSLRQPSTSERTTFTQLPRFSYLSLRDMCMQHQLQPTLARQLLV